MRLDEEGTNCDHAAKKFCAKNRNWGEQKFRRNKKLRKWLCRSDVEGGMLKALLGSAVLCLEGFVYRWRSNIKH